MKNDEILVSAALRVGVALAAASSLVGAGLYFWRHAGTPSAYGTFHPTHLVPALTAFGLLSLSVAILIATPIVRVAILIVVFLREQDWLYSAISGFVLAVLLLSLHG